MIRNPSKPLPHIQYKLHTPFRYSVPRHTRYTMLFSTLFTLAGVLCSLQIAFAAPGNQSIALIRRQLAVRTVEDWGVWAKNEREALNVKYGGSPSSKRSQGTNL